LNLLESIKRTIVVFGETTAAVRKKSLPCDVRDFRGSCFCPEEMVYSP
jgi:hypothetical protein